MTETRPRGTCPGCGRDFFLYPNGTLRRHSAGFEKRSPTCHGSGRSPDDKTFDKREPEMDETDQRRYGVATDINDARVSVHNAIAGHVWLADCAVDGGSHDIGAFLEDARRALAAAEALFEVATPKAQVESASDAYVHGLVARYDAILAVIRSVKTELPEHARRQIAHIIDGTARTAVDEPVF